MCELAIRKRINDLEMYAKHVENEPIPTGPDEIF
jgi:hypothetical protein